MDVNLDGGFSKPFASCNCSNNKESESGAFECNICFDTSQDPVVTLCGHLYCWPCLYQWLQVNFYSQECPVCKAIIEEEKLVPIYGRGKGNSDNIPRLCCNFNLPKRPMGQRPPTAPPVQIHYFRQEEPGPTGLARVSAFLGLILAIFGLQGNGTMRDNIVYGGNTTEIPYFFPTTVHAGYGHSWIQFVDKVFFKKMFFLFLVFFVLVQFIF